MKKNLIATLILSATLLVAPTQMVYATEESQAQPSTWAQEEVSAAIEAGYVPEALQARYQEPITRQEFVDLYIQTVFTEIHKSYEKYTDFQLKDSYHLDERGMTPEVFMEKIETTWEFADTDNLNARVAQVLGVINGDQNKNFNPNDNITREQVAVMLINGTQIGNDYNNVWAREYMTDMDTVSDWANRAVDLVVSQGFMKGNSATTFNPKGTVSIEQAILMCYRVIQTREVAPYSLRGYQSISRELLENYKIDGDTIYVKEIGYDARFSLLKHWYRETVWGKPLAENYSAEKLLAHKINPVGDSLELWEDVLSCIAGRETYSKDNRRAIRCLEGQYQKHIYGDAFIVEHNVDGYLTVIRKQEGFNYYLGSNAGRIYLDEEGYRKHIVLTEVIE